MTTQAAESPDVIERLYGIEARLSALESAMVAFIEEQREWRKQFIEEQREYRREINTRFERLEQSVDRLNERSDRLSECTDRVEENLGGRIDRVEENLVGRIDRVGSRIDRVLYVTLGVMTAIAVAGIAAAVFG